MSRRVYSFRRTLLRFARCMYFDIVLDNVVYDCVLIYIPELVLFLCKKWICETSQKKFLIILSETITYKSRQNKSDVMSRRVTEQLVCFVLITCFRESQL